MDLVGFMGFMGFVGHYWIFGGFCRALLDFWWVL
jgi:hypothetical protein